jgi:hypothetical protein
MGELSHVIDAKDFRWDIFVETGTGLGSGLIYARMLPFKHLYSFEINQKLYYMTKVLEDSKTEIYNMNSYEGLDYILPKLKTKDKVLFWLDAHYPGADFDLSSYDAEKDENKRLPLIEELKMIRKHRQGKDTVIIDDLRIYTEMEDDRKPRDGKTVGDIKSVLASTHDFDIIDKDEIYGVFRPKCKFT